MQLPYARILMTGASGFVGLHLMAALRGALPADARVFRARSGPVDGPDDVTVDFADRASVLAAIDAVRPDAIVHLAGQASVASAAGAAAQTWTVNVSGAIWLAEAVERFCPTATVLFASSAEVYGTSFLDGVVDETTTPRPVSVYARSKLAAEQALTTILPDTVRLIIARPTNHIGPGQDERFVLPSFAAQLVAIGRGEQAPVVDVGNLDSARDFMDVRDVVAAYVKLLALAPSLTTPVMVILASGQTRTIRSMLDSIVAAADTSVRIQVDPARARPSEIPVASVNPAKVRGLIDWDTPRPFAETIRDVLDDMRQRHGGAA